MIDLSQIHPVTDFVRHYKSFLNRIKETGNPEVLTVNGKPEYVIMDARSYQAIANEMEKTRLMQAVNEGIEDMKAGGGEPVDAAFSKLRTNLELQRYRPGAGRR